MRTRSVLSSLVGSLALSAVLCGGLTGCAGRTFDVKVIKPVPADEIGPAASVGRIAVRIAPMWDEDWQLETLDANAAMAGVLPVRAHIENESTDAARPDRLRFRAVDGHGREWRRIDAKKARKRIEKFYGVRLRIKEGDKLYRADFEANVLDTKSSLPAGGHRQGLLFFEMPKDVRRAVPVTVTAAENR